MLARATLPYLKIKLEMPVYFLMNVYNVTERLFGSEVFVSPSSAALKSERRPDGSC